jgi:parallel beta-helix repeat protein
MKSILSRRNFGAVWVLIAVVCIMPKVANCRTITVQADGNGDYPTIQDAIDDSNDGDIIICSSGTYTGPGNRDIDFLGKAITVRSENGPENCIIDCNGTTAKPHRGFYFHSGESPASTLSGFTIKRGKIYGSNAKGGGIYCTNSSPKIENCIIADNTARAKVDTHAYGGGIYIGANSSPVIENCVVSNNQVIGGKGEDGSSSGYSGRNAYGAGIYCGHSGIIDKCRIYDNQATGGKGGSGLMFGGTGGAAYGGGIYCQSDSTTISNCLISDNHAVGGTGGHEYADLIHSYGGPAYGGGLSLHSNLESTINNCLVTGNEVEGGVSGDGEQYVGYIGDTYGAGIEGGTSETKIQNCIIWNNRGDNEIANCSAAVTYSNVKGGRSGTGNIKASPLFLEPGFWDANGVWVEGDYHFWPESPCVDTGDPDYIAGPNETDLDGNPRVIGGRVDMGVYEFTGVGVPEVVGLEITGSEKVSEFSSAQYKAAAHYDNGETRDVTTWSAWSLQLPSCGSINNGVLITERIETAEYITIYAQYSSVGVTVKAETTVQVAVPVGLEITGPQLIPANFQTQYNAVVYYDDGQTKDVTSGALWEIEPQIVAEIDQNGLLHTKDVNERQDITIYARYTAGNVTTEANLPVEVYYLYLYVPDDYETIQEAIDASINGDVIILAEGIYTGTGNRDIDFLGKVITVRSIDPNDPNIVAATVIDCNATADDRHRGFKFHYGEDADSILKGLTIMNGYALDGGGIYCNNSSGPTIANCTITGNTAGEGGGIYCDSSSPTITNCTITGNSAYGGGSGIYCWYSSPTIISCTISGNMGGGIGCRGASSPSITSCVVSDNAGVGIGCSYKGTANITDCVISGNKGSGISDCRGAITNCIITGNRAEYGAGLCFCYCPITNCIITDNIAEHDGGGIYESPGPIVNCVISNNTARSWCGGGVYLCWGPITNCLISGNRAGHSGGGLFECNGPITNCTIAGNWARERGGGLSSCEGPINNCIIWGNRSEQIYASGSVTYSNVQDGWEGEGNIDTEPLFAFTTDCHIMPDSPCIDAGTNDPCGGLPATDIEGVPRPLDGDGDANAVADMGAYEYTANSPSIAVSAHSFYFVQNWPGPEPQTLQIRNCGGRPLHWEIVEDCNWLEAVPANGVSTGQINEVTMTVDPNGLAPGLYSYDFRVQDSNASNSPVTIRVTMPVGRVLSVPSPDYPTIQVAIDAADNYDIVLVADGNYTGDGNKNLDFRGKPTTVCSENGPNNCTIDCENSGRGFYFQNGETEKSFVDGFTITNGGIGIYCLEGSPTINNCNIFENDNGILCRGESSPKITNCTITDNGNGGEPESAGGITYGYFSYDKTVIATVTNCTISNNVWGGIRFSCGGVLTVTDCTISNNTGTGIHCRQDDLVVANCTISGNWSWREGGGIFCGGSSTITNCTITGNSAKRGGGIYCSEYYGGGAATIDNCTITSNYAYRGLGGIRCGGGTTITNSTISQNATAGWVGGIGSGWGSLTMTNCVVAGNSAGEGDGGITCFGNATITNCTITGNTAVEYGGGISCYRYDGGSPTITNCILWGNTPEQITGSAAVTHSDVQSSWPGTGNIDEDPCFVQPGHWDGNGVWVEGDYHLFEASPCIDAGDNNAVPGSVTTDLDGNPRFVDEPDIPDTGNGTPPIVDMGAFEADYIQAQMQFTPQALNLGSKGRWIKAHFVLPEGFLPEDVDTNTPAVIAPLGIESDHMNVFIEEGLVEIEAAFSRSDFCGSATSDDVTEVIVIGLLNSGQNFYGTDTIRIIDKSLEYVAVLAVHWLEADCGKTDWCSGADLDQDTVVDFVDFALFDGCCIEVIEE